MSAIETRVPSLPLPGREAVARVPLPSRPAVAPSPRRRIRPRRAPARGTPLRRGLFAIVGAGVLAAAVAAGSVAVAQQAIAVSRAQQTLTDLTGSNHQLVAELASLGSPARISSEAAGQLGMHQPAGYVPVQPVAPAPATPAPGPRAATAVLPVPAGPAPGGTVAISRSIWAWATAAWRHVPLVGG